MAEGQNTLEVRLEAPAVNGVKVAKIYRFHRGSYVVDVSFEIANMAAAERHAARVLHAQGGRQPVYGRRDRASAGGAARVHDHRERPPLRRAAGAGQARQARARARSVGRL